MRAGALRTLITIEHKTETIDSVGDPVNTWATFSQAWAEIKAQSGKEFMRAREINSSVNMVIRIRYLANVKPNMRINHSGDYYNILSVFDPNNLRKELMIYCDEQL